jgi:hypothetical protein
MFWIIALIVYLFIGCSFNMKGFEWYKKIFLVVFWLPILIILLFVFRKGDFKIM